MRSELLEEIRKHYSELAPHIKERKSSELLKEALDELEKFNDRKNWTRSYDYKGDLLDKHALYLPKLAE